MALTGWTTVARLVRAETLSLKARDFTRAAQALGARPLRIMFRHILPNALGSLVVATTLSIGSADPARIRRSPSSASAPSRRRRAGATC